MIDSAEEIELAVEERLRLEREAKETADPIRAALIHIELTTNPTAAPRVHAQLAWSHALLAVADALRSRAS